MKNLALAFCSLRPVQLSKEVCDAREDEYLICLKQLKRVLPDSFDLLVCENTIDDTDQLKNTEWEELLSDTEMCAVGSEGNIGTRNKGMGELLMLKTGLDQTNLDQYENISYISARKVFTCPYVFEKTERLEKSALISNPDFLFLDGRLTKSNKEFLFNDMFFSMKREFMVKYAEYSMKELDNNLSNHIGSEQNLYNYIITNDVDYEMLDFLGLIRNDWEINGQTLDVSNYHIC